MTMRPAPPKKSKLRPDVAETAFRVMQEAIGESPKTKPPSERSKDEKNPLAVARGAKGGKSRAAELSGKELAEIGKKGSTARWKKKG